MKKIITLLFIIPVLTVFGQYSVSVIDHNNAAAHFTDAGVFFNNPASQVAGYELPKGSGKTLIYASALWFAGTDVNGQLKLAAPHYGPSSDIFPGPVANPGEYIMPTYQSLYGNAIWSVTKQEIDNHILNWNQVGYTMPSSIANWPGNGNTAIGVAEQLAPYVDVNGNDVYEPAQGDYPNIRGDEAAYVIMNDIADLHNSGGDIMGIEVHMMLYQYSTGNFLNDVTFINTRVFNRGNISYNDFKTSFYADADLGNYSDDYFGSDSVINMIYTYNADAFDESNGGNIGYGADPPAIGIMSLSQPMSGACYYTNAAMPPTGDPISPAHHWSIMNNMWSDGSPWVYGGTGYPGSPGATTFPTNYMLGGDPLDPTQWSEVSNDFGGSANPPGDRRMLMNLPAEVFQPGDQICYDFAVVYGRSVGTYASVQTLKNNAAACQLFFDAENFGCQQVTVGLEENESFEFAVAPNPSTGIFNVELGDVFASVSATVVDMTGRVIYNAKNNNTSHFQIDLTNNSGVFILMIESPSGTATKRLIVK